MQCLTTGHKVRHKVYITKFNTQMKPTSLLDAAAQWKLEGNINNLLIMMD